MFLRQIVTCMPLLLLCACASTSYDRGKKLLAQDDYTGAVDLLTIALEAEPRNAELLVDLAEAHYHLDSLDQARVLLDSARAVDPDNSAAVLLLGLTHEKSGDTDAAIAAYGEYAELSQHARARKVIKARLDRLIRERIVQDTKKAVAQEAMLDLAEIPDNTVAVAPFRNMGWNESLAPLKKGLAEMMITDLSKVPGLKVVERLRMQEMMKEIGLSQTGAMEMSSAPRLGKLLGANRIVNGSFAGLSNQQLRLDIRMSETKTGKVGAAKPVVGPMERLFRLQKDLTFGLIEDMGIELTDEQRDAIQEIPTENMLAFIAYSKGLDLEDQGQPEAAAAAFEEAATLDPGFEMATEAAERVELADIGGAEISVIEDVVFEEVLAAEEVTVEVAEAAAPAAEEALAEEPIGTQDIIDRLAATGQFTGAGFIPTSDEGQSEVREPLEEQEEVSFESAEAQIQIRVPLPGGAVNVTGRFEEEE